MNTRAVGAFYEDMACAFLEKQGLKIIKRNFRVRLGEIDIIAQDADELVFIEVKYRKDKSCGGAEYAISKTKQDKIRRTAQCFMKMNGYSMSTFCRFDAVLIDGEDITHVKKAWM